MKNKAKERFYLLSMVTLDINQKEKHYILKVRAKSKQAAYECAQAQVEPFIFLETLLDIVGGGDPRKIYRMPEGWKNDKPEVQLIQLDANTRPGEGDLDYVRFISVSESLSEIHKVLSDRELLDEETAGLLRDLYKGYEWMGCYFGFHRREVKQCISGDADKYEYVCQCFKTLVNRIEDLSLTKVIKEKTLLNCRVA